MEIEGVVTGGIVVLVVDTTGIVVISWAVPDPLSGGKGGSFLLPDALTKRPGDRSAPTIFSLPDCQGIIDDILPVVHEVDQVLQGIHIVVGTIHMDVDPAAVIYNRTVFFELPDDFLKGAQIIVLKDRGNKLNHVVIIAVIAVNRSYVTLRPDRRVPHDFPVSALAVPDRLCVVASACRFAGSASEHLGYDVGGHPSGDTGEFDFNSEVLVLDKF